MNFLNAKVYLQILLLVQIEHLQWFYCRLGTKHSIIHSRKAAWQVVSHVLIQEPFHLGQLPTPPCQTLKTWKKIQLKLFHEFCWETQQCDQRWYVENLPLAKGWIVAGGSWPSTILPAVTCIWHHYHWKCFLAIRAIYPPNPNGKETCQPEQLHSRPHFSSGFKVSSYLVLFTTCVISQPSSSA